jgi:hypothetical protein
MIILLCYNEIGFGNTRCSFEFPCDSIFGGSLVKVIDFKAGVGGALKSNTIVEDCLMEVPYARGPTHERP